VQNNIYVDTNIVIDMCDNSRKFHKNSFELITAYLQEEYELFINSDTLSNLFYILSNHSVLNKSEIVEKMRFINEIFTLVSIESDDIEMALDLLSEKNIIELDDERKATMVSNLMVVLTSDKDVSPIVNTGTIY